jgi:autotransporter-associated beta strand protein
VYLNAGVIDATSVRIGLSQSTSTQWGIGPGHGYLHLGGGVFRAATVTMAHALNGEPRYTGTPTNIFTNTAVINVSGGILEAAAIQPGTGTRASREIRFNNGAIRNIAGGNLTISGLTLFEINGAGPAIFESENGYSIIISSSMSGDGTIVKTGLGTLTLGETNTFAVGLAVNEGAVDLGGELIMGGALSVGAGGSLSGAGKLTFGIDGASSDPALVCAGNADLSGLTLNIATGAAPTKGMYMVVEAAGGTLTGMFANVENMPEGYKLLRTTGGSVGVWRIPRVTLIQSR